MNNPPAEPNPANELEEAKRNMAAVLASLNLNEQPYEDEIANLEKLFKISAAQGLIYELDQRAQIEFVGTSRVKILRLQGPEIIQPAAEPPKRQKERAETKEPGGNRSSFYDWLKKEYGGERIRVDKLIIARPLANSMGLHTQAEISVKLKALGRQGLIKEVEKNSIYDIPKAEDLGDQLWSQYKSKPRSILEEITPEHRYEDLNELENKIFFLLSEHYKDRSFTDRSLRADHILPKSDVSYEDLSTLVEFLHKKGFLSRAGGDYKSLRISKNIALKKYESSPGHQRSD